MLAEKSLEHTKRLAAATSLNVERQQVGFLEIRGFQFREIVAATWLQGDARRITARSHPSTRPGYDRCSIQTLVLEKKIRYINTHRQLNSEWIYRNKYRNLISIEPSKRRNAYPEGAGWPELYIKVWELLMMVLPVSFDRLRYYVDGLPLYPCKAVLVFPLPFLGVGID